MSEFKSRLEIDFYDQGRARVLVESDVAIDDSSEADRVIFTIFALRQLTNVGLNDQTAATAMLLAGADNPGFVDEVIPRGRAGDVLLVNDSATGRYRFFGDIDNKVSAKWPEGLPRIFLKAKGFGLLGRGIPYYAPTSVIVLLSYLYHRRLERDSAEARKLLMAATAVGAGFLTGEVKASNVNLVVMQLRSAWRQYDNSPFHT